MRNVSLTRGVVLLILLSLQVSADDEALREFPSSDVPIVIEPAGNPPLQISGIYPHLSTFNGHNECGIGAVVPWAGRLWWITYPPHKRTGSNDKLYSTDESLALTIHPESVGGTHAARMIHRPSNQLFIGPYAIDSNGDVRAMDVTRIPGRYTAYAEHLTQPDEKIYLFDMEGPIWEIDTKSLEGERLFVKPAPGWHGKGACTGQGRLVIANNGESSAARDLPRQWEYPGNEWETGGEAAGVLSEFDGEKWNIVKRRQFVEVAGPGGIDGADASDDVLWAMGWDRRSVLLELLDEYGNWVTYRLPKASHAMDPRHGWYTEWPRIRPLTDERAMLCMHGMLYDFPLAFGREAQDGGPAASGIRPICSHLRYITDFCHWNDQLVISADDTSILENKLAGQSQSNLWFGSRRDIEQWGSGAAYGGPWLGDRVTPSEWSDWYLFAGFKGRVLHLAAAGGEPVEVEILYDLDGTNRVVIDRITIPASGYTHRIFDDAAEGEWIGFNVIGRDQDDPVTISAYLHYAGRARDTARPSSEPVGTGLRSNDDPGPVVRIRPAGHNRNLQVLVGEDASLAFEVDQTLAFHPVEPNENSRQAAELLRPQSIVTYDDASAIVTTHDGRRLRFPVVPGTTPVGRDVREVQSERSLAHIGNTFYEVPRGQGGKHVIDYRRCRPVSSHSFGIHDFCTWRGLLVLASADSQAAGDGHVFAADDGGPSLWFGCVDDLWGFGKPIGDGGPWKSTTVKAGVPSDPYLMTGFDQKTLRLSHDRSEPVSFRLEIDYSNRDFWKPYATLTVQPDEIADYRFPAGYSAHWIRIVPESDCAATALFEYR